MVSAGFFDRRSHDEEKDISLPALIDMTANDRVCQLRALPFFPLRDNTLSRYFSCS